MTDTLRTSAPYGVQVPHDTAERIARVVSDMVGSRLPGGYPPGADPEVHDLARALVSDPVVVDVTPVYASLTAHPREVALYEDHPCITPPWRESAISYVNEHGNVVVMHTVVFDLRAIDGVETARVTWEGTQHPVDWDQVRWAAYSFVWLGGHGNGGRPFPTSGPYHLWRAAVGADGTPMDLNWVQVLPDYPMAHWDMAHLVLLGSLNLLNCNNVEAVVPARDRPTRRRLARTGVQVHTITVRPLGRASRSRAQGLGDGVPLTSVRGHFSSYGPRYGRGLLFGKYEGRYWIPQHARGSAEVGEVAHDYRVEPGG